TNRARGPFAFDLDVIADGDIVLRFLVQEHLKNGNLGAVKAAELSSANIPTFPDPVDRAILTELLGKTELEAAYSYSPNPQRATAVKLAEEHAPAILRQISDSGKLFFVAGPGASFTLPPGRATE
ncbi:MAG: hypothetical protein HC902_11820, partial [Calothrix sp. SM1_5_4]|nr:hypothetical protein [Calothrix sp. SM1_5_4]